MSTQLAYLSYPNASTVASHTRSRLRALVVAVSACLALLTAGFPVARSFLRVEITYNEGWNIYNTIAVVNHQLLYPSRYSWTTVNYPMLSFVIMAQLHRLTHEYLFTARVVSLLALLGSAVLVGTILRLLGASRQTSLLTGLYCFAIFTTDADFYVGMDDPQMLAQFVFLAGLLLYVWRRDTFWGIAGAALLFVVGGSIKHNLIDIPLAVLIDLVLLAPRRALWFAFNGLVMASVSIALQTHFGGPYFLAQMLIPRSWSVMRASGDMVTVLGPMLVPFSAAIYLAFKLCKSQQLRILTILLFTSLLVGGFFGGGSGVSINALFDLLISIALLNGLFMQKLWESDWIPYRKDAAWSSLNDLTPMLFFTWLIIPWMLVPAINSGFDRNQWDPMAKLHNTVVAQKRFDEETATLRSLRGPTICESLLLCYYAKKPYIFDAFNSTRLIQFGKLDPSSIVANLQDHRYGAVQLDSTLQVEETKNLFDPRVVDAIKENYVPVLVNEDGEIYVPRKK